MNQNMLKLNDDKTDLIVFVLHQYINRIYIIILSYDRWHCGGL